MEDRFAAGAVIDQLSAPWSTGTRLRMLIPYDLGSHPSFMPEMAQQVSFCKSWFRAKKCATEMWGRERAQEAHKAKTLYTVLVGTPSAPTCFLEINDKFVGVGFLDAALREALYYSFQEVEPGVLFLGMATSRTFQGDSDKVAAGTTYMFKRSGQVQVQRQRFDPHEVEASESSCDVRPNYSRWPEFGEYDDLVVVERAASREMR